MTEADDTVSTAATWVEVEPAIYDLVGAASLAAMVLDTIREKTSQEERVPISYTDGLGWLEGRLSAAAENLLAIHEKRATNWSTMVPMQDIQHALELAEKRGEIRAAENAARGMGRAAA
jgi:hypothetical protein